MSGQSWSGDWHGRLEQRLQELGHDSLVGYMRSRPGQTIHDIASDLGSDQFNEIQIITALRAEAELRGEEDVFARELLARVLLEIFPTGWPAELDEKSFVSASGDLAFWVTQLPLGWQDRGQSVIEALLMGGGVPLAGWLPRDGSDPTLVSLIPPARA